MKSLIADIGNSRLKLALFENDVITSLHAGPADVKPIDGIYTSASYLIVSSVSGEIPDWLLDYPLEFRLELTHRTPVPIELDYESVETLGMDRLAAACGARMLYPNQNLLITDAGSCITHDFVQAKGVYKGGMISPGIQMRLNAMHMFTGSLPKLHFEDVQGFYGNDTKSSMLHGVQQGVIGEYYYIKGLFERQYQKMRCVLTGGNTDFFVKHLKNQIFAHPNLVLLGLNQILKFNVEQSS